MGCTYSKGVAANGHGILKQPKELRNRLLETSRTDDVVADVDSVNDFHNAGLLLRCCKENVACSQLDSKGYIKLYNVDCLSHGQESIMLRALGVSESQDNQISVRFEEKPRIEQEEILIYLYLNWQVLQQHSAVIEALKETKFVTSGDGKLYKPKDLFDPGDALLKSVFSGVVGKFPGERFVSDGWLDILRKTGLQNASDADIILECARRVELLGVESTKSLALVDDNKEDSLYMKAEVSLEIWYLAKTLVRVIFENFEVLNSNNFCNILGEIACIPAAEGFPFESGNEGGKRVLCSYSEAILLKDWPLAWSAAPIIYGENLVPPEYSWGALQLKSPPPFTTVLKHLQVLYHTDSTVLSYEEATFELLQYLDRIWDTLSPLEIPPIVFELPSLYLPFVKILKDMKLQETLSISRVVSHISDLHKCDQRLGPNDLRAVIEFLHFLYNEITENQNSDRSDWESLLYVPDDSCKLVHSNSCVYIDAYGSRYLKHIDTSKLRFVHHDVSERLCLAFGIRKVSDVVVEELDCVDHLRTLEEIGSVSLVAIKQKLLSREFQVAVSRVFNAVSNSTTGSEKPSFQTLQRSLESVSQRLQFVQCIYTHYRLLPDSLDVTRVSMESMIPEWESGSRHRALYYVDRSNTVMLIAEPPSYVSVLDLVAAVVSHILGSPVPLPIGSLFFCPQDSEAALVDVLKLSYDERVRNGIGSDVGFLDTDLLPQDAKQVQLKPFRPFYNGEIVAWQSKNEDKLKYGRIPEDVRPSAGQELYQSNIKTSRENTETIISSPYFWFKSFSSGYKHATLERLEDGDNVVSSMCVEQRKGSQVVKLRNQGQPIEQLQHGRLPAEELMQAVEAMLSGAGIRMDTEKQFLFQTTLSFQERIKESQAPLLLEQGKLEIATNAVDKAKTQMLCRICLSNVIDITIASCGHVLCHQCSYTVSGCPFCRVQISKTRTMYGYFGNILGEITCIPAEKNLPYESGKRDSKRVLGSYSITVLLKDWPLAWSAAPILTRESLVPPEYSWGALLLKNPPPFTAVLKHLQAKLHTGSCLLTTVESSLVVLKYLDRIWVTLSNSDILELKHLAFIAADNGTHLVSPSSLFVHLSINLSPLASKLPLHYLPFVKMLKELGSEDKLSISSAMKILLNLQRSSGYRRLNTDELHAVIEILHFLCNETIEQQMSNRPYWKSELVVPDNSCRLVHAYSSVYIDSSGSQYVKFIDSTELRFVHHYVSERLCSAFGIRKLSDIVVEELDCVEKLQILEEIGSVSLANIKQKLLSRTFQVALSRVLNSVSSSTHGSENLNFQTLQLSLESVSQRLQFVQCIYTRFWLLPKKLDITNVSKESVVSEWESGSCHRPLYYVDSSNTCMLIADPPSYVSVIDLVAIVVSRALGFQVPLPIASLISCPQDSEIALVSILKLSCAEKVMDYVSRGIGFLGRELNSEDAKEGAYFTCVKPFYKGEIVAWYCKKEEKLKYGRIPEDVRPPEWQPFYRIKVETFPGKTESIISSMVYTFFKIPVGPVYPKNRPPTHRTAELLKNQDQRNTKLEHSGVPADELVQAIEEALSGVGKVRDWQQKKLARLKQLFNAKSV